MWKRLSLEGEMLGIHVLKEERNLLPMCVVMLEGIKEI